MLSRNKYKGNREKKINKKGACANTQQDPIYNSIFRSTTMKWKFMYGDHLDVFISAIDDLNPNMGPVKWQ